MAKCYFCDNESSSVEHTPPKGFFPKDMRNNLITVPSCPQHNEDTSKDDEYVRNIITMSIENNQISIDHFFEKSFKSFKRSPALTSSILNSLTDVSFYKEGAQSIKFDRRRFDKVIRKISYALFYHEYGYSWNKLLAVMTNQIKMQDLSNDHLGDLFNTLNEDLDILLMKGDNPNVFQYAFLDVSSDPQDKVLFFIFYEGFPFWIIPEIKSDHSDFD